jgi:uncharacterized ion transporter superfamily protein YfcC
MEATQRAGAQISTKAFVQSVLILFILMLLAGVLTRVVPAGSYATILQGDRKVYDPASFQLVPAPAYPAWRWFTAPLEVLGGPDKLTIYLGWDSLTGLGMSILATNMGFSAAVTNPFTIGVAQKLAGLPLFSRAWQRILIFLAIYAVLGVFLVTYARKIEREPQASSVYAQDQAERRKYGSLGVGQLAAGSGYLGRAMAWFGACVVLILCVLLGGPLAPALSDYSLPLVGILFLVGGLGAGFLSGTGRGDVLRAAGQGISGTLPAIPLILMAASIKYIVAAGGIMDTILHSASLRFAGASPLASVLMMYVLALVIEFFVASGSAKACLLIPILMPLGDLVGVTRQAGVTAYCFGDGFSNLAYPTNPVLLICLGLTAVGYPAWLKWTAKLWAGVLVVTVIFLAVAVAIGYGPF